jgi:type I restriction enzyme, R subunit
MSIQNSPIPEADRERDNPNEFTEVERPFLAQLVAMGWNFVQGEKEYPANTLRTSFNETVLLDRLRAAIRRVNRDGDAQEWLDDLTIERAVREFSRKEGNGLMEINRNFSQRLINGVRVAVAAGPRSGEDVTLHAIAWAGDRLLDNEFLAINQFRVLIRGTPFSKYPDIVLFVNGLPIVVVECKGRNITNPLEDSVDQLLHYSDQRGLDHSEREGMQELFHFNALLIGSSFDHAVASTVGDTGDFFSEWKDTSPVPAGKVLEEIGKPGGVLSGQETLVAGMLRPAHLLDLMRNFIIWDTDDGRLVKKVARYQQFRAVHNTINHLLEGKTRRETGDDDTRGGVVWHTQGSGKSLTMVFLVKKLRTIEALRAFKVVIVSDRTQLERQLRGTMSLTGENVRPADGDRVYGASQIEVVQRILREHGPDLVFCMIQKNQDMDRETETLKAEIPAYIRLEKEGEASHDEAALTVDEKESESAADVAAEPVKLGLMSVRHRTLSAADVQRLNERGLKGYSAGDLVELQGNEWVKVQR